VIPLYEETLSQKIFSAFFRQAFSNDLKLIVVWLCAAILGVYLPVLNETPLRVLFTLPVLLFIPGYCIILALFPGESDIDLTERIVLSMCVSIAVVPLVGLGLNFTPWGIRLDPIVIALTVFTMVIVLVAHYQRTLLPVEEQFRMPFKALARMIQKEILPAGPGRLDRILGPVLALAIIIAILTTIFIIAVPREGEQFTEFFILGENRTAANYPIDLIAGQNYPMYVSIGNHEHRRITYTIETWMMLTEFDNVTNTFQILTMDPLDRLSLTLAPNQTTIIPYNLSVNKTGYNRVEFLLFNEKIPGFETVNGDRINASYRNLHLRLDVWERQNLENEVDITG
jgi:uncharacterized membrane protein